MLRSILLALDGSVYSESAAALAIDWAGRYQAWLRAIGVLDAQTIQKPEPVPLGGLAYKRTRDEARLADARRRVVEFLSEFRDLSRSAGVRTEIVEEIGEPAASIVREAQRCDVVILARETHFHFETQDRPDDTLAQVVRNSPRPVVVVPARLPDEQGIVVAYGGGREVARTLQIFLLLGLAAGESIEVVSVHHDGAQAEALAQQAGGYLAAHGAPHRLHAIASTASPAEVLLEQVRHVRPRLVVMGAHGHHPLRELFSTSITRAVLRACPVPVFVGA